MSTDFELQPFEIQIFVSYCWTCMQVQQFETDICHSDAFILIRWTLIRSTLIYVIPTHWRSFDWHAMILVLWNSQNPELNEVFRDLMDSDGSEITLVDASFFAPPGQKRYPCLSCLGLSCLLTDPCLSCLVLFGLALSSCLFILKAGPV